MVLPVFESLHLFFIGQMPHTLEEYLALKLPGLPVTNYWLTSGTITIHR